MELELKHLAGYLPYGLKIQNNKEYDVVVGWDGDIIISKYRDDLEHFTSFEYVKPILHPLSDLTKEIEVNGEKFIPIDVLDGIRPNISIYKPLNVSMPIEINIDTENYSQCIDLYDGFLIIQKLLEWHFDIYGLIDAGLAIDKNTLEL